MELSEKKLAELRAKLEAQQEAEAEREANSIRRIKFFVPVRQGRRQSGFSYGAARRDRAKG